MMKKWHSLELNREKEYICNQNINNPEKITVFNNKYEMIHETLRPEQLTGYEYELLEACEAIRCGKLECSSMPHKETIHMMELMDECRRRMKIRYPME